ncbi:MAG: hypothetical protein MZV64_26555 [Ignavibacteriales bacterium]|nr:hypothetical protein [Ignavibacteriales bacterium]
MALILKTSKKSCYLICLFYRELFTGAALGYRALNNKAEMPVQLAQRIAKTFLNDLSIPIGGVTGGLITGEIAAKLFPINKANIQDLVQEKLEAAEKDKKAKAKKHDPDCPHHKYQDILGHIDPGVIGSAYAHLGLGSAGAIGDVFSTMSGFKVGREDKLSNRLLKATSELIAGVIVPIALCVPAIETLKAFNVKLKYQFAAIGVVGVASCFIGGAVANFINQKVTEKLVKKEFWEQIATRQQEVAKKATEFKLENIEIMDNVNPQDSLEKLESQYLGNVFNPSTKPAFLSLADTVKKEVPEKNLALFKDFLN